MSYVKANSTPNRKELTLNGKGTLLLTKELQDEIAYLHRKVGSKEWCGVLFYKKVEGDISDPKTLVLRAEHIYLMDIGREAYTDADFDANSAIDQWTVVNDDYSYKRGLIHTHHNMQAFFSGTDMSELHENTHLHNYYLSLIVNFSGNYVAKVAFIATRTVGLNFKNSEDESISSSNSEELLTMIDMDIVKEEEELAVPELFRSRYEHLKQEAEKARTTYYGTSGNYGTSGQYGSSGNYKGTSSNITQGRVGYNWGDDDNWDKPGPPSTTSKSSSVQESGRYEFSSDSESGKYVQDKKENKILKPIKEVQKGMEPKVLEWLRIGCEVFKGMEDKAPVKSENIEDYLEFYEDYFSRDEDDTDKNFWLDRMQHNLTVVFSAYKPAIVKRVAGGCIMWPWTYAGPGMELFQLLDVYPKYVEELEKMQNETSSDVSLEEEQLELDLEAGANEIVAEAEDTTGGDVENSVEGNLHKIKRKEKEVKRNTRS